MLLESGWAQVMVNEGNHRSRLRFRTGAIGRAGDAPLAVVRQGVGKTKKPGGLGPAFCMRRKKHETKR